MRILLYLFVFSSTILLSSCGNTKTIVNGDQVFLSAKEESGLVHTVYFWYKDDASREEIAQFEREIIILGTIKSIDHFYYGWPAATAKRGPVDNSFDLCVNIFFRDIIAHNAYQKDPIHLEFIDKTKDLWEKVIVYDNEIR